MVQQREKENILFVFVIFFHRSDGKKQEILYIFFFFSFLYSLLLFTSLSLPIQCNTNEIQHSIPFRSYVIKQATFLTLILVQYIYKEQGMHTPHTHTNTFHSLTLFGSLLRSFAHSLARHISRCARLGVSTSSLLPRHGSQRNLSHSVAYTPSRCICIIHIFVSAMPMLWLGTFYRNVFVYLFVSRFFCQANFQYCLNENIIKFFRRIDKYWEKAKRSEWTILNLYYGNEM